MHILHLPIYHSNFMAIRPRAQAIELTQHIHTSHDFIDDIPSHAIVLGATTAWQRFPTRIGILWRQVLAS